MNVQAGARARAPRARCSAGRGPPVGGAAEASAKPFKPKLLDMRSVSRVLDVDEVQMTARGNAMSQGSLDSISAVQVWEEPCLAALRPWLVQLADSLPSWLPGA